MTLRRLLIANRGEIAVRIARTARDLGIETVGVHGEEEPDAAHLAHVDHVEALPGSGAQPYLDVAVIVEAARRANADAVHPGYGLLSESAELSAACAAAALTFVGPTPETLRVFGDKAEAKALAAREGVPLLDGLPGPCSAAEAESFRRSLGEAAPIVLKAISGGGGRGMRRVGPGDDLEAAFAAAEREAEAAFGRADLYVEAFVDRARHIEVQIIGDGAHVASLGDRECTLQRRHQKLIELAPAGALPDATHDAIHGAALTLGRASALRGVATVEFLVDADDPSRAYFLEVNPRLQVEHTVTEEVTGFDLVAQQLRVAGGETLANLGLADGERIASRGAALQARINVERMKEDGSVWPSVTAVSAVRWPGGPGVRIDAAFRPGAVPNARFDSLFAKLVVRGSDPAEALRRAQRALDELEIVGPETNTDLLGALIARSEVATGDVTTRFVETHVAELVKQAEERRAAHSASTTEGGGVGARIDASDPLAVLDYGRTEGGRTEGAMAPSPGAARVVAAPHPDGPPGTVPECAPLQGTVLSFEVEPGDPVAEGTPLAVLEAMKMEHVVAAATAGRVHSLGARVGDTVAETHPLVFVEPGEVEAGLVQSHERIDPAHIRPDLQQAIDRHTVGLDAARSAAVEKRHARGHRTARENLADLVDPDSFVEYGPLVVAAQRRRRALDDLIENTPADGMVAGIGTVNGHLFDEHAAQAAVVSYDYMVLAGTQGAQNHRKKDRLFELADRQRLPLVLFAEGGGGRPGDTDGVGGSGLDCLAFALFAELSGRVPLIGIANGRCFAGNAALLGCCDVVIATEGSNIGMGGPAMVEGGGLGVFRPEEIGPLDVQVRNGVVDIAVADEAEAVAVARKYLGFFQGRIRDFTYRDQRELRHVIPENRLRVYDVRSVIDGLCDSDSVLELRRGFGHGMVTALARVEGRPLGIVANDPTHLGGAIDAAAADKAARFMQLCDAHDLPILFLCDTPGIMVGPEAEREGTVRHAARMFVTAASLDVPFMTIVLRKGYGLGAQAMAGGSFKAPLFTVAWPTGEFGGMGLEGAVKLGMRRELEAETDPEARRALYERLVDRMYENGKAVSTASFFEIDDVIDPAESRHWIGRALASTPPRDPARAHKRPMIDPW